MGSFRCGRSDERGSDRRLRRGKGTALIAPSVRIFRARGRQEVEDVDRAFDLARAHAFGHVFVAEDEAVAGARVVVDETDDRDDAPLVGGRGPVRLRRSSFRRRRSRIAGPWTALPRSRNSAGCRDRPAGSRSPSATACIASPWRAPFDGWWIEGGADIAAPRVLLGGGQELVVAGVGQVRPGVGVAAIEEIGEGVAPLPFRRRLGKG